MLLSSVVSIVALLSSDYFFSFFFFSSRRRHTRSLCDWSSDVCSSDLVRSADWQLSHLYSPRALAPDSVMPAFPWLFDGAPDRPTQEGRDLLAYLETLGRARELAGPEGEARARAVSNGMPEMMSPVLNA